MPVQVSGLSSVMVAAGGAHSLAIRGGQSVWSWGLNLQGQVGDGTLAYSAVPVTTALP